jgi:hypothetical protein
MLGLTKRRGDQKADPNNFLVDAQPACLGSGNPKRLVSLLEIVKLIDAGRLLGTFRMVVGESIFSEVAPFSVKNLFSFGLAKTSMPEHRLEYYSIVLGDLEEDCKALGMSASIGTIEYMRNLLSDPIHVDERKLGRLANELHDRMIAESQHKTIFSLSPEETEYFSCPRKGWEDIIERFPDVVSDVEESRKCFALARYAASIFHSMQIVEVGLIELGTFIHVADPKSGWTAVAQDLKRIMAKEYKDRSDFERNNFGFLEQVQGTVEALKNAWRNKISHAHGKLLLLSKDFSPEIAEEILFATRAFMRRLATGLPPVS